jgi:hypothetical protein
MMGMSRSPVVICGNVNSRRVIHAPSAIAGPLHESATSSSGCRTPISCQNQDRHSAQGVGNRFGLMHASPGANCGGDGWISRHRASSSTGLPVRKQAPDHLIRQLIVNLLVFVTTSKGVGILSPAPTCLLTEMMHFPASRNAVGTETPVVMAGVFIVEQR